MFCGCNEQRSSTETIVEHYIEDISTEGATASTLYRNNKIISTTIEIFGETGKRTICYAYEKENIAAIESTFTYNYLIYQTPGTTQNRLYLISGTTKHLFLKSSLLLVADKE